VVRDTRYAHLREEPPPLHFDLYCQAKEFGGATYIVRTKMKASEIAPSLRCRVSRFLTLHAGGRFPAIRSVTACERPGIPSFRTRSLDAVRGTLSPAAKDPFKEDFLSRPRYQNGCLKQMPRKSGLPVWVYR
jgi:hypothetical protein